MDENKWETDFRLDPIGSAPQAIQLMRELADQLLVMLKRGIENDDDIGTWNDTVHQVRFLAQLVKNGIDRWVDGGVVSAEGADAIFEVADGGPLFFHYRRFDPQKRAAVELLQRFLQAVDDRVEDQSSSDAHSGDAKSTSDSKNEIPQRTAKYIGKEKIQVGDDPPFVLETNEDNVIQALLELGGAAKLKKLQDRSGVDDAPRVLKVMRKKYPLLRPFIRLPGGKGKGGYRISIVDGREQAPESA